MYCFLSLYMCYTTILFGALFQLHSLSLFLFDVSFVSASMCLYMLGLCACAYAFCVSASRILCIHYHFFDCAAGSVILISFYCLIVMLFVRSCLPFIQPFKYAEHCLVFIVTKVCSFFHLFSSACACLPRSLMWNVCIMARAPCLLLFAASTSFSFVVVVVCFPPFKFNIHFWFAT